MSDVRPLVLIDAEKLRNLQNNLKGFYDLSEECEALKHELEKYRSEKLITPNSEKIGGCETSQKQEERTCENKEISQKNKDNSEAVSTLISENNDKLEPTPGNTKWYEVLYFTA